MGARVIGLLKERLVDPRETDAVCMKHGTNSAANSGDAELTEEDLNDGDLLVDGVQCCLCGDWIIPIDEEVARLYREREAVPMSERATHPLWQMEE